MVPLRQPLSYLPVKNKNNVSQIDVSSGCVTFTNNGNLFLMFT